MISIEKPEANKSEHLDKELTSFYGFITNYGVFIVDDNNQGCIEFTTDGQIYLHALDDDESDITIQQFINKYCDEDDVIFEGIIGRNDYDINVIIKSCKK